MSFGFPHLSAIERRGASTLTATVDKTDLVINILLMTVVAAVAFGLAYHPYYFGDELILHRLAIKHDYAFWPTFREINGYKPRLVDNGITALLADWQTQRWVTAALQVGCAVWISALLYGVVRYLLRGDRMLAWLLIVTVLTSRYGVPFYFDYSSGLLDLLGTALLLSALVAAWLAWREDFKPRYAATALAAAVLCIFVHERFVAGLLAAGLAIAIAECTGTSAERRIPVVAWALSLGLVPLSLFWAAKIVFHSMPMATGTAGQAVTVGWNTLLTALAYGYNVFLGGNYGHIWYWGTYNHLHPVGRILAWSSVACTAALAAAIVWRKGVAWRNRWLAAGLLAVAIAMIAVASLPGLDFLQPRWMFPVGILVAMTWIVIVKGAWRHVAIAVMLAINLTYLLLGTQDSIAQVSASRSANALARLLLGLMPDGGSGIVVGWGGDSWTIGGGAAVDMGPRPGDTFSRINFRSVPLHIDPLVAGRAIDPVQYDFGMAFDGFAPNLAARYRLVSVDTALSIAGVSTPKRQPEKVEPVDAGFDINAPHSPTAMVIEYYKRSLDHYLITHVATEIALLDAGKIPGWVRTGQSFPVYTAASAGTSPVCRFYIPPQLGDSHFFGRGTLECSATSVDNPLFINEGAQFFHVVLPTAGVCPSGTREVYRVFNNRDDINHRYTIDRAIRDQMVAAGWVAEGDGPNTVVMCVPASAS